MSVICETISWSCEKRQSSKALRLKSREIQSIAKLLCSNWTTKLIIWNVVFHLVSWKCSRWHFDSQMSEGLHIGKDEHLGVYNGFLTPAKRLNLFRRAQPSINSNRFTALNLCNSCYCFFVISFWWCHCYFSQTHTLHLLFFLQSFSSHLWTNQLSLGWWSYTTVGQLAVPGFVCEAE